MSPGASQPESRTRGLDLEVVRDPAGFLALKDEWEALAALDPVPVTGSHAYLEAWIRHRLRDAPLHTVVLREEGRCVGIAPLMVSRLRRGGLTIPSALYLTRNTYVPGARALMDPARASLVAAALVDYLTDPERPWTIVRLNNLRAGDALEQEIRARREAGEVRVRREAAEESVRAVLPETWSEFERQWSTNRRRTVRKKGARLRSEHRVEIVDVGKEADPAQGLEEAFAVAERSWQGQRASSIASSEESRGFYRALCDLYGPRGDLFLRVLRVDGEPVAFDFSVRQGTAFFELKRGFVPEFGSHGVGAITIAASLEQFFAEGGREVEFFHPSSRDKLSWGTSPEPYGRVTLFRRSAAGTLLWALSRLESLRAGSRSG